MFYKVFDRKTPRHNWRGVGHTNNETHFRAILDNQTKTVQNWDAWPKGQVGYLSGAQWQDIINLENLKPSHPMTIHLDKGD